MHAASGFPVHNSETREVHWVAARRQIKLLQRKWARRRARPAETREKYSYHNAATGVTTQHANHGEHEKERRRAKRGHRFKCVGCPESVCGKAFRHEDLYGHYVGLCLAPSPKIMVASIRQEHLLEQLLGAKRDELRPVGITATLPLRLVLQCSTQRMLGARHPRADQSMRGLAVALATVVECVPSGVREWPHRLVFDAEQPLFVFPEKERVKLTGQAGLVSPHAKEIEALCRALVECSPLVLSGAALAAAGAGGPVAS